MTVTRVSNFTIACNQSRDDVVGVDFYRKISSLKRKRGEEGRKEKEKEKEEDRKRKRKGWVSRGEGMAGKK